MMVFFFYKLLHSIVIYSAISLFRCIVHKNDIKLKHNLKHTKKFSTAQSGLKGTRSVSSICIHPPLAQFFSFFSPPKRPKSRTFIPKNTECQWDVNLILFTHALPKNEKRSPI